MTKTITIKDDVYKKLLMVKREGESFSELFERLIENISPLETLKKLRGCVEFKDKEAFLKRLMRQGLSVDHDNFGYGRVDRNF